VKKASDFDGEIYKEALEKLKKCRKGTETDEIHELLQIIEPNNMVPDITINPYFRFLKRINQVPPEYHFAFS